MSDTMFPKREERVPYSGGKPVRERGGRKSRSGKSDRSERSERSNRESNRGHHERRQPEPQKKPPKRDYER